MGQRTGLSLREQKGIYDASECVCTCVCVYVCVCVRVCSHTCSSLLICSYTPEQFTVCHSLTQTGQNERRDFFLLSFSQESKGSGCVCVCERARECARDGEVRVCARRSAPYVWVGVSRPICVHVFCGLYKWRVNAVPYYASMCASQWLSASARGCLLLFSCMHMCWCKSFEGREG